MEIALPNTAGETTMEACILMLVNAQSLCASCLFGAQKLAGIGAEVGRDRSGRGSGRQVRSGNCLHT